MRLKNVINATVTDLGNKIPFGAGGTVVVLNLAAAANTLQQSAASTGPFATIPGAAAIPAGQGVEVTITERYVAVEDGSGLFVILAN
jgi:hypothetical protein